MTTMQRSTPNYMNPDDFDRVLKSIPLLKIRKQKDEDVRMLFIILYWIGLRPSEAIYLKAEDFDLENHNLYLGKTKTHRHDIAPIPDHIIPALQEWLDDKENGRLFPDLTYRTAYNWIKRLGVMLQIIPWITHRDEIGEANKLHIFRKSLGKDLLTGTHGTKMPIEIISKQLRHQDIGVTLNSYLKSSHEAVKEHWKEFSVRY